MLTQIKNAFAALNTKMLERQLTWALCRQEAVKAVGAEFAAAGKFRGLTEAKIEAAGGKAWLAIVGGSESFLREAVAQNVAKIIARRDAQIVAAITKAGITELPEFELVEVSDGAEGAFYVAGHKVTIRTILAGGYNIQCLHQRTLVKVK